MCNQWQHESFWTWKRVEWGLDWGGLYVCTTDGWGPGMEPPYKMATACMQLFIVCFYHIFVCELPTKFSGVYAKVSLQSTAVYIFNKHSARIKLQSLDSPTIIRDFCQGLPRIKFFKIMSLNKLNHSDLGTVKLGTEPYTTLSPYCWMLVPWLHPRLF